MLDQARAKGKSNSEFWPIDGRACTGSKFSGSGFEIRYRVGLGFHEFVSKPVALLKAKYKYAMLLIIEPIRFSTAGLGVYWAQALSGFWLM